jgi:threonine dehydratase
MRQTEGVPQLVAKAAHPATDRLVRLRRSGADVDGGPTGESAEIVGRQKGDARGAAHGLPAMRLVASIGMPDDETAVKNRYAHALADGRILVLVEASTDERKELAAKLLREHGGKFVNFLERYTIEPMVPPLKR